MVDGAVFGNIVDRLGAYESLQMEPDQLKEIAKRYKEYEHLFKKA